MTNNFIPQSIYNQILKNVPIVCVDIVVIHWSDFINKKYLLINRKDKPAQGEWWIPGGRLHKYESFYGAAKRILKDETGIKISDQNNSFKIIAVANTLFPDSPVKNNSMQSVNIVCYCEVPTQKITLNSHSSLYKWIDINEPNWSFDLHKYIIECFYCNVKRKELII